jgi:hypothetical protein
MLQIPEMGPIGIRAWGVFSKFTPSARNILSLASGYRTGGPIKVEN